MLDNFPSDVYHKLVPLKEGKFDRWLGFVQGALWAMDKGKIDSFREDVRDGKGLERLKEYLE